MISIRANSWLIDSLTDKMANILVFDTPNSPLLASLIKLGFKNISLFSEQAQTSNTAIERYSNPYDLLEKSYDYTLITQELLKYNQIRDVLHVLRFVTKKSMLYALPLDDIRNNIGEILNGMKNPVKTLNSMDDNEQLGVIDCNQERSFLRKSCDNFIINASLITCAELKSGQLLYVGTAGDPDGGEYTALFPGFVRSTADADPRWSPDIVCDITKTNFRDAHWDVIVCSNVIEHIPNINMLSNEMARIIRPGGHLLIDCPWNYPYHAEPPSFGDYWRISLDGFNQLFGENFSPILAEQNQQSTHLLYKRVSQK